MFDMATSHTMHNVQLVAAESQTKPTNFYSWRYSHLETVDWTLLRSNGQMLWHTTCLQL